MASLTQDLRFVGIDDDGYAQAVALAKSFQYGDDESGFAFTGKATLMFQRTDTAWDHSAFRSSPIITHIDPIQGAPDAQDANDEAFLEAVADRVTFMHVPSQCLAMEVDHVWGVDCEFLMFAMPHPQNEEETAWMLIPGPEHRTVSLKKTVQDYQFAEIQRAAAELGLMSDDKAN